ncbi:MAG: beta strand repeat-containing protein, partial [Cytophagales bacterium]
MKKYLLPSLLILFAWQIASAQVPNKISYQAVVRNTNGTVVSNTGVGIRISVLQNSQTGNIVYAETQVRQTNLYGLFNLIIGDGNIVSGNINSIDWSTGVYFLKSEIDPAGGSNYVFISTTQLLSVPYALYAKTAGNAGSNYTAGSGISISGTNQIVNTSTNIPITLKDGGIVTVSGAYPNFTISGAATSGVNYTAGTGIVISGANVVVNSAPNIPVSLTGIGNVAITGTNNNFTINGQNLVAGSNITISGNAISAATPTSTPFTSIVGINGSTVTGTNNNFTINSQNLVAGSNITISGNAISAATPTSTPFTSIVGINGSTVTGTNNNFTINSQNLVAGSNITISGNAINAPSQNPLTSISGNNGLIVIPNGQAFTLDGANFIRTIVGLSGITINKSGSNYSISGSNTSQWLSPSANQIYTNSFVGIGVSAPLYSLDVNGDIDIATATAVYRIAGNVVLQTKGGNMMLGGAGNNIMTGDNNILNGAGAGINISSGFNNVINGYTAGQSNTTGYQNVFNGVGAGYGNTIGLGNVFEGNYAGSTNTTGNNNVAIGKLADLASNNLSNAIAIGANATVGGDNMMALGGTGLNAVKVGIGTGLPTATLDVIGNGRFTGSVTLAGLAGNVANLGVNANGQVITVAGNTGITSILGTNGISVTQNGSLFTISGTNSTLSGGITRIIEANMSSSANPSLSSPYKMVYDNIVSDIFNEFSSSTFTPKQPGYYLLECYARILFNDGDRLVLYKNGSYLSRGNGMFNSAGGDQSHVFSHNTFIVQANGTTDYFEVFAENQDNTAGTVVAIDQGYFKAFQLNAQSGTLTVTSVNSGSNSTITGNNGLIVIPNGNAFTLDGANFIRTIVGLSGITVNQSGSNYSISGSGGLTGAGQTNGLAYYTSANTLTS